MKPSVKNLLICLPWACMSIWIAQMALAPAPQMFLGGSTIEPNPAKQGATVTVKWVVKNQQQSCPKSIHRFFYDADKLDEQGHPELITAIDALEYEGAYTSQQRVPRSFTLPPNLPPNVDYQARVCFKCNKLQQIWPKCIMTPMLRLRMSD